MDIEKHPLIIKRKAFYATWYGALTRADSYVEPTIGSILILIILNYFIWSNLEPLVFVAFLFGGFIWGTLYEYLNHRYLFHEWVDRPGFRSFIHIHIPHHIDLTDGINAGPFSYIPILTLWLILLTFFLNFYIASTIVSGMILWFMCYEYHHDFDHKIIEKPNAKSHSWIMRLHHDYHHLNASKNFGVTTRFWDRVFGTFKDV